MLIVSPDMSTKGKTALDLARECLERNGFAPKDDDLAQAMHRVLIAAYNRADPVGPLTARQSAVVEACRKAVLTDDWDAFSVVVRDFRKRR